MTTITESGGSPERARALMGSAACAASPTSTRQEILSANYGAPLIVAQCGWTKAQEAERGIGAIVAGLVPAATWTATADGRAIITQWAAAGEADSDAVFYERLADDGRIYHGWVDAASRKIVQTG